MTKFYLFLRRYLTVLLVCGAFAGYAQQAVTGKVASSDDGSGIPGVNVLEKGTTNGTVSDSDGNFKISVGANATLVFSFVGYVTQEVAVGSQSSVNVTLQSDVQALSEVVVIGYGQVEAKDKTGATVSLKSADFNQGVIVSPEQLMQGKVAGVQITSTSGEPGAANNIRIRGTSSVTGGNQPLYVVDGIPLSNDDTEALGSNGGIGQSAARNPLNFLNPADIERIDVLKDASATAIYGSRGANGVVIITTKQGKSGKSTLNFSANFSMADISKKYDLLHRDAYLAAYTQYNGATATAALDKGANTDWQDQILRTGYTQTYNLGYGGGDKTGSYNFSTSYMNQGGIVQTSGLKRYTMRFNGTKKFIHDKLTLGTQFTFSNTHQDNVPVTTNSGFEGDVIGNMLKMNPTQPVYESPTQQVNPGTPDPSGFYQLANTEPNPVAMLRLSKAYTNTLRFLGNVSAEIEIVKGLKFKTMYALDRSMSARKQAFSRLLNAQQIYGLGRLYLANIEVTNQLWENYLTFDHKFGSVNFNAIGGYSYQSFETQANSFELSHFRTDNPQEMINNMASSDQSLVGSVVATNSSSTKDELQSYYGRFNFGMSDKYLLTATIRADGSTRFGANNKYGVFPSAAFKWRLSEEAFIPEVFSDLSLRVSYGVTGNQQIPHNLYTDRVRFADWSITGPADGVNGGGLSPVAFNNPDLKWESTAQANLGFDFQLFDGKLRGSLDFYSKNTTNMLVQVYAAEPAKQPYIWKNLPNSSVTNKGIELALEGNPINGADFKWTVGFNMAYNKNLVAKLGTFFNTGEINGQGLTGAYCERISQGQPLYAYYVRQFGGFDANGIAQYTGGDVQKFVGKGPLPKWNLGLNNTFTYKHLDLNFFFNGQLGQYVYSNTANAYFTAGSLANGRNTTTDIPGNGEGKLNAPDVSTRFLYNASFVRLQNMTLGYNLKTKSTAITALRFTLTGQNLFVITSYPFQDPEVSINKQQTLSRDVPGIANYGIDYTTYPRARTFTVGVAATF